MGNQRSGIRYRDKAIEDMTREELIAYIVVSKSHPFIIRDEGMPLDALMEVANLTGSTGRLAPYEIRR